MKKTLIISYTPRTDSNTKKLLDCFIDKNKGKTEITFLDITKDVPDLLLEDNLNLLFKQDYAKLPLTDDELNRIKKNEEIINQFLATDYIVLAYPMYNFSLPATVKSWVDAIIRNTKTFRFDDEGNYIPLCMDKEALVLMTTGGDYTKEPFKSINFATPEITQQLGFIGVATYHITAYGLDENRGQLDAILNNSKKEIDAFGGSWY